MSEQKKNICPYSISEKDSKVFLTVYPSEASDTNASLEEIKKAIRSKGTTNFEDEVVSSAITAATGKEVLICEKHKQMVSIEVSISNNDMLAEVIVHEPIGEDMPHISRDVLVRSLQENGVRFGIIDSVVDDIVDQKKYEEWIVVARGKPKKDGVDGWNDYKFSMDKSKPSISEKEDGSVDFHELNLIENVVEDQLLGVKMPSTAGEPGITVTNEHIECSQPKEAQLLTGKNTKLSEDGNEIYAAANGQVKLLAGRVVVDPVYEIKGTVGSSTGNINFLGDIVVRGSVEDTFNIKATGNIDISQSVGKCNLEADGDIIVHGGILGKNEALIKAGGSVMAKFIQDTTIEASGDVIVSEAIMHSRVDSGKRVICLGKKGLIVGGTVRASHEVNAKNISNKMSTKTNIEVGLNPKLRQRLTDLEETIKKDKDNFFKVKKGIATLTAIKQKLGNLPPDKETMLTQLVTTQTNLIEKLKDVAAQVKEIQAQLSVKIDGKVAAAGTVYPGTKITISSITFFVDREYSFSTFKVEAGEIRTTQYEKPRDKKKKKEAEK